MSFKMNQSQNQNFFGLFNSIKLPFSPFGPFYRSKWQISLPFYTLQPEVIGSCFNSWNPCTFSYTWSSSPLGQSPLPCIGPLYREYLHSPGSQFEECFFQAFLVCYNWMVFECKIMGQSSWSLKTSIGIKTQKWKILRSSLFAIRDKCAPTHQRLNALVPSPF